jgi:hypothetical protein
MLQEADIPIVSVSDFWMQEGGYRSKYWDLAKWGADFRAQANGAFWRVYSWNTMTDCVRNGFSVQHHEDGGVEIHAKAKNPGKQGRKNNPEKF